MAILLAATLVGVVPALWVLSSGAIVALIGRSHSFRADAFDGVSAVGSAAALGLIAGVTWRLTAGNPANYRLERP